MRRIIGPFTLIIMLFLGNACGQKKVFTVTGQLLGSVGDTLTVEEMAEQNLEIRFPVVTDKEGRFTFTDTARNPRLLFIQTPDNHYITLMVLANQNINLTAEKGKINETIKIEGSNESQLVLELNTELARASTIMDSLGKLYMELGEQAPNVEAGIKLQNEFMELFNQQNLFIRGFIDRNYSSAASLIALSHQLGRQSVLNPQNDFDLFARVDSSLFDQFPESSMVSTLHRYVEQMKPQMEANLSTNKTTGIGAVPPEITLPSPDGNVISLSSFRGKYVLLDFWAAWCGPCRKENPNLVSAYKLYKDKNFEIFQVSLDRTREDWVKAIEADNLPWVHVSDLMFWDSPVAKQYGVQSIPANFLLDPEGKIIARNLRGAALDQKLSQILR